MPTPRTHFELIHRYWQAANYLSIGQIYLQKNALLREPLKLEDIKPRLLGHWGTTPGLNFIYVHLNRIIKAHDLNMILIHHGRVQVPAAERGGVPRVLGMTIWWSQFQQLLLSASPRSSAVTSARKRSRGAE
jgi:hypothetical protein